MINSELRKIEGSVLAIGLDSKKQSILENNKKICECYLLDSGKEEGTSFKGKSKTINIRKIKKVFKKKRFDYIVGNFLELEPYLRSFIKNSIYLNKGKLYFYNMTDFDLDELKNRYSRYNACVEIKKNLIIIDNSQAKTNVFKNIFYYICDLIYDVIDYIGKILVN